MFLVLVSLLFWVSLVLDVLWDFEILLGFVSCFFFVSVISCLLDYCGILDFL